MSKIQLSKNFIRNSCKLALAEDLYPSGDITSNLLDNNSVKKFKLTEIFRDSFILQLYWSDNIPLEIRKPYTLNKKITFLSLIRKFYSKKVRVFISILKNIFKKKQ